MCRELSPVERLPDRSRHRAHGCPQIGGRERRRAAWVPEILGGRVCETRREQTRQGGIIAGRGTKSRDYSTRKQDGTRDNVPRDRGRANCHPSGSWRTVEPFRRDRRTGRTASGTGTRARRTLAATRPADADATAGGCRPVSVETSRAWRARLPLLAHGCPSVRLMAHTSNGCRLSNCHPSGGMAGEIGTAHRSRARRGAPSNRHPLNP